MGPVNREPQHRNLRAQSIGRPAHQRPTMTQSFAAVDIRLTRRLSYPILGVLEPSFFSFLFSSALASLLEAALGSFNGIGIQSGRKEKQDRQFGILDLIGSDWIRTSVDFRQRVYSPSPLTTRAHSQESKSRFYKRISTATTSLRRAPIKRGRIHRLRFLRK